MKRLKLKYVEKFTTFNNKPKWFLKIVSLCLTTNYIKFHTQYGHRFYSLILNASTSTNLWIKANSLWCIMTKSSVFFFQTTWKDENRKKKHEIMFDCLKSNAERIFFKYFHILLVFISVHCQFISFEVFFLSPCFYLLFNFWN